MCVCMCCVQDVASMPIHLFQDALPSTGEIELWPLGLWVPWGVFEWYGH